MKRDVLNVMEASLYCEQHRLYHHYFYSITLFSSLLRQH